MPVLLLPAASGVHKYRLRINQDDPHSAALNPCDLFTLSPTGQDAEPPSTNPTPPQPPFIFIRFIIRVYRMKILQIPFACIHTRTERALKDEPATVRPSAGAAGCTGDVGEGVTALIPRLCHRWDSEALKSKNAEGTGGLWEFALYGRDVCRITFFPSTFRHPLSK